MGPEMNANQLFRFQYDRPCRLVGDRKYAILWLFAYLLGIFTKPVGNLLLNENDFMRFTAFWLLEDQLLILKVLQSESQHLSDPHSATSHQFEH